MKKQTIILIIVFLVGGAVLGGFIGSYYQFWKSNRVFACASSDLNAVANFGVAAGNVYGNLAITNKTGNNCTINGDGFVQANYDTSKNGNIGIVNLGLPSAETYTLKSGQSVYTRVHMPNGPQCSTGIHYVPVTFSYNISDSNNITFTDSQGKQEFSITACDSPTDLTQIDITNLSNQAPPGP